MDKRKLLDELIEDLEKMTDDELIEFYNKNGIKATKAPAGCLGSVTLTDSDTGEVIRYGQLKLD